MVELNPDIWSKLSATTKMIIGPIIHYSVRNSSPSPVKNQRAAGLFYVIRDLGFQGSEGAESETLGSCKPTQRLRPLTTEEKSAVLSTAGE